MRIFIAILLAACSSLATLSQAAAADPVELHVAKQFGLGYLPLVVMEHDHLIETEAAALGVPNLKVNWVRMGNALALNDLMFSGRLDFSAGSPPALILLWSKTRNNRNATIMGVGGLSVYSQLLNTKKPTLKSIRDFGPGDKIAMGGIKTTASAIVLQMAAERAFGSGNAFKLDPLTVSLPHPDGMAAMLSGKSEITAHLTAPPYQYEELKDPGVRTILNSDEVMGGKTTGLVTWTTVQFKDRKPLLYKAYFSALKKAIASIQQDKQRAAQIYIDDCGTKSPLGDIVEIMNRPDFSFDLTPHNFMTYANFMKRTGVIDVAPVAWKDLFFADLQDLPGS